METKIQRVLVNCQGSHSKEEVEFKFDPILLIANLHYQQLIWEDSYNISKDK